MTNTNSLKTLAALDLAAHAAEIELFAAKKNGTPGQVLGCKNALADITARRDALAARLGW